MNKAIFYHAGCPVCVSAESRMLDIIDTARFDIEIVHLGDDQSRIDEAEKAGVTSVPAILVDGDVLHINFGAALSDVRQ